MPFAFRQLSGLFWRAVAFPHGHVRSHPLEDAMYQVATAKTGFVLRVAGLPRPRIEG